MTDLLGIVGSVSESSKTRVAVERALAGAAEQSGVDTGLLHLAEYDIVTADGRTLDAYEGDTAAALDRVVESDAYLLGSPVYRASYSGLLKNFLDMIPRGQWQADVAPLENAAVGLIATGASDHHYLSIDEQLRPVTAFFGAHAVGGGVYASAEAFESTDDGYELADGDVAARLETLGTATADLSRAIADSEALSSLGPQI